MIVHCDNCHISFYHDCLWYWIFQPSTSVKMEGTRVKIQSISTRRRQGFSCINSQGFTFDNFCCLIVASSRMSKYAIPSLTIGGSRNQRSQHIDRVDLWMEVKNLYVD